MSAASVASSSTSAPCPLYRDRLFLAIFEPCSVRFLCCTKPFPRSMSSAPFFGFVLHRVCQDNQFVSSSSIIRSLVSFASRSLAFFKAFLASFSKSQHASLPFCCHANVVSSFPFGCHGYPPEHDLVTLKALFQLKPGYLYTHGKPSLHWSCNPLALLYLPGTFPDSTCTDGFYLLLLIGPHDIASCPN